MQFAATFFSKNVIYSTTITIDMSVGIFIFLIFYRNSRFKHILIYAN